MGATLHMRKTRSSKKGFTLLEVMLSIAILTIVSTMIMQGFLASMNYATNNSVYARLGANNYSTAIRKLAENSSISPSSSRDAALLASATDMTTINYGVTGGGGVSGNVRVERWRENDASDPHINVVGTAINDHTYDEGGSGGVSNVLNRTSFFYIPSESHVCGECGGPQSYGISWGTTGWFCNNQVVVTAPLDEGGTYVMVDGHYDFDIVGAEYTDYCPSAPANSLNVASHTGG